MDFPIFSLTKTSCWGKPMPMETPLNGKKFGKSAGSPWSSLSSLHQAENLSMETMKPPSDQRVTLRIKQDKIPSSS